MPLSASPGLTACLTRFRTKIPDLWNIVDPIRTAWGNPRPVGAAPAWRDRRHRAGASSQAFQEALLAADYDATLTLFEDGHKIPHDLTLETIAELVKKLKTED